MPTFATLSEWKLTFNLKKMKFRLLFLSLFLAGFCANAQFRFETHGGDAIVDGETVIFSGFGDPDGNLKFWVYNDAATPINMMIEFVDAINADGTNMELCFGNCYTGLIEGFKYPLDAPITIQPGEHQTSVGDHFLQFLGGSQVEDYIFRLYQVDGGGNEIGDDLTFTYRYDPTLGVADSNKLNFSMQSTVINGEMVLDVNEPLQLAVYDIQGRLVKNQQLEVGRQLVNMSDLSAQTYICKFQNKMGQSQVTKVVVK